MITFSPRLENYQFYRPSLDIFDILQHYVRILYFVTSHVHVRSFVIVFRFCPVLYYMYTNLLSGDNFRLSYTERVLRQQFQMWLKKREVYRCKKQKIIEGKGEIALYEQFLLFSQYFS